MFSVFIKRAYDNYLKQPQCQKYVALKKIYLRTVNTYKNNSKEFQ